MNESVDKEGMHKVLDQFPKQIIEGVKLAENIRITGEVTKIIVCGMGGSALAGDLLKDYLFDEKIMFWVVKDYNLPSFTDKNTMIFVNSYSGNTEETISAYRVAYRIGAKIVALTSGGKLETIAKSNKTPIVKIPSGIQPRNAVPYIFFSMLTILINSKIIRNRVQEIQETIQAVKNPAIRERGESLALRWKDRIPLIYTSEKLRSIGYIWKISINENAKTHAFSNVFSEMNHNELNGFVLLKGTYYVVFIEDEDDYKRIKDRFRICKTIIKEKNVGITEIVLKGDYLLARMFTAILIGQWAAYYLALGYNIDPTPVHIIEDLKRQLGE